LPLLLMRPHGLRTAKGLRLDMQSSSGAGGSRDHHAARGERQGDSCQGNRRWLPRQLR